MPQASRKEKLALEIILVLISVAIACLLFAMQGYKLVVLNLFFLPVALGAFYLGRYRAGVLALFCGVSASLVVTQDVASFCATTSPLVIALAMTVWMARGLPPPQTAQDAAQQFAADLAGDAADQGLAEGLAHALAV